MGANQQSPTLEDIEVECWRESQLERAGFTPEVAAKLAINPHVDLHEAEKLIAGGCSVELAERILS
jgi:hypothetical protein